MIEKVSPLKAIHQLCSKSISLHLSSWGMIEKPFHVNGSSRRYSLTVRVNTAVRPIALPLKVDISNEEPSPNLLRSAVPCSRRV
jgi:hypothetical protein